MADTGTSARESGGAAGGGAWRVPLPPAAKPPLRVFLNAIPQQEGRDYEIGDGELLFDRPLVKEKVGFWRWTAMFLALFGSYGRNDSVDVEYVVDGRKHVATNLPFIAPDGADERSG